jgi:HEAT repeat protein
MSRVFRSMPQFLACVIGVVILGGCSEPAAKPSPTPSKPAAATQADTPPKTDAKPAKEAEPAAASSGAADKVAELIKTLTTTDDSRTRVITIDAIAEKLSAGLPALDALSKALEDSEPRVRWHAARAIGLIGHEAAAAIPSLVKLLKDSDPVAVTQAAWAIGHIRNDDPRSDIPAGDAAHYAAAVEPLLETMTHPDPRARRAAVRSLKAVSTSKEQVLASVQKHLADADPSAVMPALHTMADMGADAVPFLIDALEQPESRFWAEVVLSEIGPAAAAAAEPLAKLAKDGSIEDRVQSILALARIGGAAKVAGPVLVEALESPDESLRYVAAYALGAIKFSESDAQLEKAAQSDDPFLATLACWARARINPGNKELRDVAVERLMASVSAESPQVRRAAVEGLSELDDELDAAQRKSLALMFSRMVADPVPQVALAAGAGLIRLGPDAVEALRGMLSQPDVRQAGMEILTELGPVALPALDDIVAGLGDTDPVFRADACMAVASIGPEAKSSVGALEKLLADEAVPAEARYPAVYALGRIGPAAAAAEPLVRKLAESEDEIMATVAVWAALKINPDDASLFKAAVPKLRHTLNEESQLARLEAAVALGEIGPPASTALPMLDMMAEEDPSPEVRTAAEAAAKRIRAKD